MCIELRRGYQNLLCQHFTLVAVLPCLDVQFSSSPSQYCARERREIFIAVRMHPQLCEQCVALAQSQGQEGLWSLGIPIEEKAMSGDGVWTGPQQMSAEISADNESDETGPSRDGTRIWLAEQTPHVLINGVGEGELSE